MRASAYRTKKLGGQLKRGSAVVRGRCTGGDRWPDTPHYWIVDDLDTQTTYHVLVSERPSWERYAPRF
jgi:hypothetical protein